MKIPIMHGEWRMPLIYKPHFIRLNDIPTILKLCAIVDQHKLISDKAASMRGRWEKIMQVVRRWTPLRRAKRAQIGNRSPPKLNCPISLGRSVRDIHTKQLLKYEI
jgi:hypothetical protein